jgi:predicted lipoprotein with Yx(FWY)xxD motif
MKTLVPLLIAALLAVAGCGDDEETPATTITQERQVTAMPDTTVAEAPAEPKGTRVTVRESDFGTMLFDSKRQAIYIFENDRRNRTVCYDECAEAWPPVFTDGEPVAGKGVDAGLLGTIERRDGKRQVTYAGQPLYFYAHEGPGEVRCHNVNLNGGLWWVVGPDGKRRP